MNLHFLILSKIDVRFVLLLTDHKKGQLPDGCCPPFSMGSFDYSPRQRMREDKNILWVKARKNPDFFESRKEITGSTLY